GRGGPRPGPAARPGGGAALRPPGRGRARAARRRHRHRGGPAVSEPTPPGRRDVFDELFALLTPERLLRDPRADGEGVRGCVIDRGVERALLEEKFRRRGQEIHRIEGGVFTADRAEPLPYDGRQSTPHGTTVADILLTIAPRVRLYSADVFGPQGS